MQVIVVAVTRAEILLNSRRAAVWFLFALSCANAVLWWAGGPAISRRWATNADFHIARLYVGFTFLTTPFFTAMLMGDPVIRDYRFGVVPLLLSKPVSHAEYLAGKFAGNLLTSIACFSGFALTSFALQAFETAGMIVLPWRVVPYVTHFVVLVVVPHLTLAALFFTVGTLTRSAKLVYALVPLLYVVYFAVNLTLVRGLPLSWRIALDPLATHWIGTAIIRGRTDDVLNELTIAYGPGLLASRVWLLAASAVSLFVLLRRFAQTLDRGAVAELSAQSVLGLTRRSGRLNNDVGRPVAQLEEYGGDLLVRSKGTLARPLPRVAVSAGGARTRFRQFVAAIAIELRLLSAERSLVVIAPLVMATCGISLGGLGAFGAPLYPISSVYAPNSVNALLIVLSAIAIFATGEIVHRDRATGVEPVLWGAPVPDWVLLYSKFATVLILELGLTGLAALTGIAGQLWNHLSPVEIGPYALLFGVVLIPSIGFVVSASLALNLILRDRYLAHAVGAALAGGLVCALYFGYNHWLINPVLVGLWTYSDMTGLAPYRTGLALHRLYWGALMVACLALAIRFSPRRSGRADKRAATRAALASIVVAVVAGFAIHSEVERGPERSSWTESSVRYETLYRAKFAHVAQPELTRVDLRVTIEPWRHVVLADGTFELLNRSAAPIETVLVTCPPHARWQTLEITGATSPAEVDELGQVFGLDAPLAPGARATLRAEWEIEVPRGILRQSWLHAAFVEGGGTFLGGPDRVGWMPEIGYRSSLEVDDQQARDGNGLGPRDSLPDLRSAAFVPSIREGQNLPFDLRVEVTVPSDQTAIASGRLVEMSELGARRTFIYETEAPVVAFPILAGRYEERRRGDHAVFFHSAHAFNVETMLDAMDASRMKYERDFGPLPHRDLRIVEFPRLATFAESHRTTIAFSEGSGFLVHDDGLHVNNSWFVVAHEVAHQWFGNMVVQGRSQGADVLLEGLAEYAAGTVIEESLGGEAAAHFRKFEEETYLRERSTDGEIPLVLLDGSDPSHGALAYQKAGLVLHMLEGEIGRERMNAAIREYLRRFDGRESHPTIHDLIGIFKAQAPDRSLDGFFDEWFEKVSVPDVRLTAATSSNEGGKWRVDFTASTAGAGTVGVTVEVIAGEPGTPGFKSSAVRIVVGPDDERRLSLVCGFRPERIVLDRNFDVLDSDRTNNSVGF